MTIILAGADGLEEGRLDAVAGHSLRNSDAGEEPRFHSRRGPYAGTGNWREHRNVQRGQRGSAQAPSLSAAGPAGCRPAYEPADGRNWEGTELSGLYGPARAGQVAASGGRLRRRLRNSDRNRRSPASGDGDFFLGHVQRAARASDDRPGIFG